MVCIITVIKYDGKVSIYNIYNSVVSKRIMEVMYMLYKYSAILDINPMVDKYDEVKGKLDNTALEFNSVSSSLQEMSIKEQLKF